MVSQQLMDVGVFAKGHRESCPSEIRRGSLNLLLHHSKSMQRGFLVRILVLKKRFTDFPQTGQEIGQGFFT